MAMKTVTTAFLVGLAAAAMFIMNAQAAPQVLALVSTQGPVQLACNGTECAATFSSFCLQNERASPVGGTPYQLAGAEDIQVAGFDRRGRKVILDPRRVLKLTAVRTQVAVRISIAESRLAQLGLTRISVDVGENVTLLPVPQAGDDNPLSESEIALASSVLRQAGSRIVDTNGFETDAVRWLAYLANALPDNAGAEAAVRQSVVESAVSGPLRALSREAGELAKSVLSGCQLDLQQFLRPSLRGCIESSHDAYMWNLNADYWRAVRTGS